MSTLKFPPSTSDWWSDLTPIEQSDYLEEHPNSRKQQNATDQNQDQNSDVEDSGLPIDTGTGRNPELEPEQNPSSDVQDSGQPIDVIDGQGSTQDSNQNLRFNPDDVEDFVGPPYPNPSPSDQAILDHVDEQVDANPELAEQEQIVDQAFSGESVNAEKLKFALNCLLVLAAVAAVASYPGAADMLAPIIYTVSQGWVETTANDNTGYRASDDDYYEDSQEAKRRKRRLAEAEQNLENQDPESDRELQFEQATHPDASDRLRDHELELTDVGIDRDGNPRNPGSDRSLSSGPVKRRASVLVAQSFLNEVHRRGL